MCILFLVYPTESVLDVHLVLGILYRGPDVVHDELGAPVPYIDMIKSLVLLSSPYDTLTMEYIEHLLTKEYIGGRSIIVEENAFRIAIVLFSIGYYFGSLCSEPKIPGHFQLLEICTTILSLQQ
jgi:hypothetical protein